MISIEKIKEFGIALNLNENEKFEFVFDNKNLNFDKDLKVIYGLMNDRVSSKFCLYNNTRQEIVFIMDFIILGQSLIFDNERQEDYIKILLIYVEDKYRKKGIAKYYLNKLIELAIENKINKFRIYPNPDNEIFENKTNALDKKELVEYYIKVFNENGFKYKKEYYCEDSEPIYCFYI